MVSHISESQGAAKQQRRSMKAATSQTRSRDSLEVKALTIRQPWAELIIRGRKPFELRSWRTKYRGPLVIHAAAKVDSERAVELGLNPDKLVTSAFVGVALLTDVRSFTREDARLLKKKRGGEGWYPGLFSWVLTKPRRISSPIKAKGRLGLIPVSSAILRRIGKLPTARH